MNRARSRVPGDESSGWQLAHFVSATFLARCLQNSYPAGHPVRDAMNNKASNRNGLAELERRLWSAADHLWAKSPLRRTRDLLLPKLISGALDVMEVETSAM